MQKRSDHEKVCLPQDRYYSVPQRSHGPQVVEAVTCHLRMHSPGPGWPMGDHKNQCLPIRVRYSQVGEVCSCLVGSCTAGMACNAPLRYRPHLTLRYFPFVLGRHAFEQTNSTTVAGWVEDNCVSQEDRTCCAGAKQDIVPTAPYPNYSCVALEQWHFPFFG